MAETRTYLELEDRSQIRPAPRPDLEGLEVALVDPPDGELSRWFYSRVGQAHSWTDHLGRSAVEWQEWAERVETWVATVAGERAGYYELRKGAEEVELAYFGLLAEFQGLGLGGYLLTEALRRAFDLGRYVWVHTNTQDAEAALPNYLARGMRPYKRESLTD